MKKLPVLIVMLVFGLSFVGASSAGQKIEYTFVEPGTTNNICYVEVYTHPFKVKITGGNCQGPRPASPGPVSALKLDIKAKGKKATLHSGWIFIPGSSPGEYCYRHPLTNEYQCIYW